MRSHSFAVMLRSMVKPDPIPKTLHAFVVMTFCLISLSYGAAAKAQCRLALSFAMDVSSSVNAQEYRIQKGGLADALLHPDVRTLILNPSHTVALSAYEWSGRDHQQTIVGWRLIKNENDLNAIAHQLNTSPRSANAQSTAVGQALRFGAQYFTQLPFACDRHVIDISGDGVTNEDQDPSSVRNWGVLDGITVNGLVIKGATPDPEAYYRDQVIHGPDAFVIAARNGFGDYPDLIRGKLLRELRPPFLIGAIQQGAEIR
ncbi:MAG: DUF1194 domain-containing protein [Pikeienuella sp.]